MSAIRAAAELFGVSIETVQAWVHPLTLESQSGPPLFVFDIDYTETPEHLIILNVTRYGSEGRPYPVTAEWLREFKTTEAFKKLFERLLFDKGKPIRLDTHMFPVFEDSDQMKYTLRGMGFSQVKSTLFERNSAQLKNKTELPKLPAVSLRHYLMLQEILARGVYAKSSNALEQMIESAFMQHLGEEESRNGTDNHISLYI